MERFAGRYLLLRQLGRGGMGAVHLARDLSTSTECAIKRLDPRMVRVAPNSLRKEFELLTRLRHPAVVSVLELGFAPDGTPFYTMEYIPGVSADQAVKQGDWASLCHLAAQITQGLEALHGAGIVHGDLKPSNLLVVPTAAPGEPHAGVWLVDFGLAGLLDRDRERHRGTPGFAAPEIARGESPGVATDLFGLGATMYVLAAGNGAFVRPSTRGGLHRPQKASPSAVRLEEAGVPAALAELILRLLAPSPGERPSDAREVRRELERIHPAVRRALSHRLQTEVVVGRERELSRLERLIAPDGVGPRVTVVSGESGIGKSAVLGELGVRAALGSHAVYRLSCAGSDAPGALVKTLLRRLAVDAEASADDTERSRQALVVIDREGAPPADPELALLVEAGVEWARVIAQRGKAPLVLLDDWDRLDPVSHAVIRRCVLHPEGTALRWVWACRADELNRSQDDRVLLDAGQAHQLSIGPLDDDGAVRLVAARLNHNPPAELSQFLSRRTGGHPGALVEFLRAAAASGALQESDAGLTVDAAGLERIALPADFEESLLTRLRTLGPGALAAATALALWGRPADVSELRTVEPSAGDEAIEMLLGAGLVTRSGSGQLAMCPPGLAQRIVDLLDEEKRRRLHRAALAHVGLSPAERFVHLRGAGRAREALTTAATALAEHADERLAMDAAALAESEVRDEAATWEERAGVMLLERGRHRASIPYLEHALEAEPASPSRPARWFHLSRAYLRAGRPEQVGRVIASALTEAPPPRFRSLLLQNEAARLGLMGQAERGESVAREALAIATEAQDDEAIGQAAMTLGSALLVQGRTVDAQVMARRSEESMARAGSCVGRTRALGLRAAVAAGEQDFVEADRLFTEALSAARRDGLRLAAEELLMSYAALLIETGRWAEAREAHAEAARLALEDARARGVALALANLAQDDALTGRGARALRQARSAVRLARTYLPRSEPYAWRGLAQAYRISGRMRRAERANRRALTLALRFGMQSELEWSRVEYGRQCALAGRWREAEEAWSRTLQEPAQSRSVGGTILAALVGRAALRRRDYETASARLSECEEWIGRRTAPYAQAHVLQLRAEYALTEGRLDEGLDLAQCALAVLGDLPAPADRAAAALDFARIALATGADPRLPVDEWLQDASGTFERLGDHPNRERALALMVDWLHRHRVYGGGASRDRGLIQSVSRLLDSLADLRELTQRAMQMAVEQLDAERGVLLLMDAHTGSLQPVVEHGAVDGATRDRAMSFSRQAVERVARSGGPLLIHDAPAQPEAMSDSVVDLGLRSIVCVPLYVAGKVVGAVYLDDSRRPDAFSVDDRGLLEGFAHLMAVAIEKSRGHEEVSRANELLVGENLFLRREVGVRFQPRNFIGMSSAMQQVLAVVERAAQTSTTVLLTGENGTGKEMIARILHHSGKRALGSFVPVNCGAIPETLLESELFGILPNVATGVRARDGRFVQADGGTLFLDEIGDMPLKQQVALLSAIANREITPVGGGQPVAVDVRIIAATNRDLRRRVESGAFREDLFYRLNVIPIEIPPLRERKADIPALAQHFATHFAQQQEREVPALSPEFLAALMQSDWPGNVRELQNYVERIMAMTAGHVLYPSPLPRDLVARAPRMRVSRGRRLVDLVADMERRLIREALERCAGNQSRAARELGLTEQSMRYRLKRYALARSRRNLRVRKKRR